MTGAPVDIVVVGSLHYDIAVRTPSLPRLGETVTGQGWSPKFGGKGRNQAAAAARAGVRVAMAGAVGADAFGDALLDDLDAAGIDRSQVIRVTDAATGMSVALFEPGGDYGAVIVSGANLRLPHAACETAAHRLRRGGVLVLQNEIPAAANLAAAVAARTQEAVVVLNGAPFRLIGDDLAQEIDVLVVNALEASDLGGGREPQSLNEAAEAASRLAGRFKSVVVTAGGNGVAVAGRRGTASFPAPAITVVSTHGAGDTFVGTLAAELVRGSELTRAAGAANRAAAAFVAGHG